MKPEKAGRKVAAKETVAVVAVVVDAVIAAKVPSAVSALIARRAHDLSKDHWQPARKVSTRHKRSTGKCLAIQSHNGETHRVSPAKIAAPGVVNAVAGVAALSARRVAMNRTEAGMRAAMKVVPLARPARLTQSMALQGTSMHRSAQVPKTLSMRRWRPTVHKPAKSVRGTATAVNAGHARTAQTVATSATASPPRVSVHWKDLRLKTWSTARPRHQPTVTRQLSSLQQDGPTLPIAPWPNQCRCQPEQPNLLLLPWNRLR